MPESSCSAAESLGEVAAMEGSCVAASAAPVPMTKSRRELFGGAMAQGIAWAIPRPSAFGRPSPSGGRFGLGRFVPEFAEDPDDELLDDQHHDHHHDQRDDSVPAALESEFVAEHLGEHLEDHEFRPEQDQPGAEVFEESHEPAAT